MSVCPSVILLSFCFRGDNSCKYQLIFTKVDMSFDIVEICFRIANGQILSIFDRVICSQQDIGRVLSFHVYIIRAELFKANDIVS